MNTEEFANRAEAISNQALELINEVEHGGIIEENTSETQGKIKVSNALKRVEVNTEALEHVAYKNFRAENKEQQLNE